MIIADLGCGEGYYCDFFRYMHQDFIALILMRQQSRRFVEGSVTTAI